MDRDGDYFAVRFDPPFDPPYTITSISFMPYTRSGAPAVFPSVRMIDRVDPSGRPILNDPLFLISPFVGSADGWNTIPVAIPVTEPEKIFYVAIESPKRGTTPPGDHPTMRFDIGDMERGYFAASYFLSAHGPTLAETANFPIKITCELPTPHQIPPEPPRNLAGNLVGEEMEFTFTAPDGSPGGIPPHAANHFEVLFRRDIGPWRVFRRIGPGREAFEVDSFPIGRAHWAIRTVDREGRRSVTSNVERVWSPSVAPGPWWWEPGEPNGSLKDAVPVTLPIEHSGTVFLHPSGDRDYYSFDVSPGDQLNIWAVPQGHIPGFDTVKLGAALYDGAGRLVAFDDSSLPGGAPLIVHHVPASPTGSRRGVRERMTIGFFDVRGTEFAEGTLHRAPAFYRYWFHIHIGSLPFSAVTPLGPEDASMRAPLSNARNDGSSVQFEVDASRFGSRSDAISIFDVRGRLVRRLGLTSNGDVRRATWDGSDAHGRRLPSGVYFARIDASGVQSARKFLLLR